MDYPYFVLGGLQNLTWINFSSVDSTQKHITKKNFSVRGYKYIAADFGQTVMSEVKLAVALARSVSVELVLEKWWRCRLLFR